MANEEHVGILKQGVGAWNRWREEHKDVKPAIQEASLQRLDLAGVNLEGANLEDADLEDADLEEANLRGANLRRVNLFGANLRGANLQIAALEGAQLWGANLEEANLEGAVLLSAAMTGVNLSRANLRGADLETAHLNAALLNRAVLTGVDLRRGNLGEVNLAEADLRGANLRSVNLLGANLRGADLEGADLEGAFLEGADLTAANLRGANLQRTTLIEVALDQTILTNAHVYGLSVWDTTGTPKDQSSLIITPPHVPSVTVDDLEVAQFIYLLLNRAKLRNVINTLTSKAVLILGRFTPERKAVLDAMADELRKHNLLPIIFDFEGATTRDVTETIKTLAGLSLFVIADITNPRSAPLELQATVPDYEIPFVAIIQEGERPFSMFGDLPKYPWVIKPVIEYPSVEKLLQGFKPGIIDRAWAKHRELVQQKNRAIATQSIEDFVREDEA